MIKGPPRNWALISVGVIVTIGGRAIGGGGGAIASLLGSVLLIIAMIRVFSMLDSRSTMDEHDD